MRFSRRVATLALRLLAGWGISAAALADSLPPDPPEVRALAAQLIAAPDDGARDKVLADAPAATRDDPHLIHALNRAYGPLIYQGEYARCEVLANYTIRLAKARGNRSDGQVAYWNIASIEGSRGENAAALAKFQECEAVFEKLGEKERLGGVLTGASIIQLQLGDYRQALAGLLRSAQLFREAGYKEGLLCSLNAAGSAYMDQGMTDRAMDKWQEALKLAGDDESWQIYLFHNIATVHSARDDLPRALELMEKSRVLAEKQKDQPRVATDLQEIASLNARGGRLDLAETQLRQALKLGEAMADKRRETGTLSALAGILEERGGDKALREALTLAERASAIARETGEPAYIWRSRTIAGKLCRALGRPADARAAFEESIAAIEDARGHLSGADSDAAAFFEDKVEPYQQMVALLAGGKQPGEALAMAERAKARVLVEILQSPKVDPSQRMTALERAAAERQAADITSLNREIAAVRVVQPPDPARLAALGDKLTQARLTRDNAEADFFAAHPDLRRRRPPRGDALTPEAIRSCLDERTALLEYVVADDQTLLFVVRVRPLPAEPEVLTFQLPLNRKTLTDRTGAFRRTLAERGLGWETAARALGADLLGPARAALVGAENLIIVPDGPLWELPFQALAADEAKGTTMHTLWEAHPVSFAPSLTFLAQARAVRAEASPGATVRLLALGNPALGQRSVAADAPGPAATLMDDEFAPLPEAERQVQAIADLYGPEQSTTMIGTGAGEDTFKRLAGDCDVIHFATHGLLNNTAPMYSRLLMSQTNLAPDEDGMLEAWEWIPLKLRARLAVLSACETGRGKIGAGEGVLGMSWALFSAGCPASVVSQWKVDSASTTELMIAFHKQLLAGEPTPVALREAGLALAKNPRYKHPFYWAPFVLVGTGEAIVHGAKALGQR